MRGFWRQAVRLLCRYFSLMPTRFGKACNVRPCADVYIGNWQFCQEAVTLVSV